MTSRFFCRYKCGIELGDFDEDERKYKEKDTGYLHTKDRCQAAKDKVQQKNDHGNELVQGFPTATVKPLPPTAKEEQTMKFVDHTEHYTASTNDKPLSPKEYVKKIGYDPNTETLGNKPAPIGYVDHTAKGISKVKIFFGSPEETEDDYNKFLADNNGKIKTQGAQFQMNMDDGLMFAIALYYEEIKQ